MRMLDKIKGIVKNMRTPEQKKQREEEIEKSGAIVFSILLVLFFIACIVNFLKYLQS